MALDCERGSRPAKGSFLFYYVTNPLRESRNTQWLPWSHSCLDCQMLSGWPPPKKTKVATRPTMAAVSHSKFLQFLTRFHKKSTHRNLPRTLMNKTQENHSQKARPLTHSDRRNRLSKSAQNWPSFHKTDTTRLLNGLRSTKPRNFRSKTPGTRLHTPPETSDNPQPNPSNLRKSAHDFGKLTIPWCSTAFD